MKQLLKEYQEAFTESMEAAKAEVNAMDRRKKARHRLLRAKEALRAEERELLEDVEFITN